MSEADESPMSDLVEEWHLYRILVRRLLNKAEAGMPIDTLDKKDMRTLLEHGKDGI